MARKLTMFELHFDGVHFGSPATKAADGDSSDDETTDEEAERRHELDEVVGEESGSRLRSLLFVVGTLAIGTAVGRIVVRQLRERDVEHGDEIEHDEAERTDVPIGR